MFVVEFVRKRDVDVVPPVVSALVATDENDGRATRIERVQQADWATLMLESQLAHVGVARTLYGVGVRSRKCRAHLFKNQYDGIDGDLRFLVERVPPLPD